MRFRITLVYLFSFIMLCFSFSCNNNTYEKWTQNAKRPTTNKDTGWIIEELNNPGHVHNLSIVRIKNHKIFGLTQNSIYYYDGKSIKNFLQFRDISFLSVDFNDGYFAYSLRRIRRNYSLRYLLYISTIKESNKGIRIVKSHRFDIPFSQPITGIRFLNNNQILLTSYLEYGIAKIIGKPGGDFTITFTHYPFLPYNINGRIMISNTYTGNNILAYGGTSVSVLQKKTRNMFDMKGLFNFDKEAIYRREDAGQITRIAMFDTTLGAFLCYNKLVYYTKNIRTNKSNFLEKRYIHLNVFDSIETKNITDIKVFDDSDFICITNNGLLLEQKIDQKKLGANPWKILKEIPIAKTSSLEILSKDSIIVNDQNKLYLISKENNASTRYYSKRSNNLPYFSIERLAQLGTNYGVGIGDLDHNGKNDIYIVDVYDQNKLFTSLPNISENVIPGNKASQRGVEGRILANQGNSQNFDLDIGVAIGDINEDGADDLFLTNLAYSNSVYLNNGKGYFKDVTKEYNFNVNMWRSEGVVLADITNDGYQDVFCTSFFKSNKLFINNYGISLEDRTNNYGLSSKGRSISGVFGDVNNDGYEDLYVCNWVKENKLYINNGKGKFIDNTEKSGVGLGDNKESNSAFFADLNNDGYLDLFVGNRSGGNKLFLNNGNGTFRDITKESGLSGNFHTYGAVFGDFDNDGLQDIVIACFGGIKYFKNEGADKMGIPHFRDITDEVTIPGNILKSYSTGLATADFGNKGFLDLVMNQNGGYTYFLLNKTKLNGSNNYLSVKVKGDESNRDAVGAKLKLYYKNKLIGYREVSSGYGYASTSSKIQHFGLGNLKDSLELSVYFPVSHLTRKLSISPNTFITVTEHSGLEREMFLTKKYLLRFIYGTGFLIFGIELIIIAFILSALISFTGQKLNIQQSSLSKIYLNWKLTLFSLIVFYIVKFSTVESMSFYFGPAYFIINSKNVFTDDILPLSISSAFASLFLLIVRNREAKHFAGFNVLDNLLVTLERFAHGEGMLIILHRLSLLIENLNIDTPSMKNYELETLERIGIAFEEYTSAVIPEIRRIYSQIDQLDSKNIKNKEYIVSAAFILQASNQISKNCIFLLSDNPPKDKMKVKEETVLFIKRLKDELSNLRSAMQSNFVIEIIGAIDLAIEKFKEEYPFIKFQFNHNHEKLNAIISHPDFNEALNIVIQNAVDELKGSENQNKLIKIDARIEGKNLFIRIEDNGPGIFSNNIEKIFNDGFTTKQEGHGIGLGIVKKCLNKFEGEISLDSKRTSGAVFVIKLKATY